MKNVIFVLLVSLLFCVSAGAQTGSMSGTPSAADERPRTPIFRATKDQIKEVQTMLKAKGLYSGDAIGKLDDATRSSIKNYQKDNGLKATGTLNRATLEKMGIELTDKQKMIPVSESSYASTETLSKTKTTSSTMATASTTDAATETKPKRIIFRATKDQIIEAQKMLKSFGMYSGEETGKLDDATREGLKKYQEGKGLKVTGTLNQVTLEKMGIELTEKQKGSVGRQ